MKPILSIDQADGVVNRSTQSSSVIPGSNIPAGNQLQNLQRPEAPALDTPSDSNVESCQFIITHIRAGDIAVNLRHVPAWFYVAVKAEGIEWRTRNKLVLAHERNMEWDDEIFLPSELSSDVHLKVCASFEFSPTLGNGQTLRTFVISIGELYEQGETMKSFEFRPPEGHPVTPCSLLHITIERQSCILDVPTLPPNEQNRASNLKQSSSLAETTDKGHEHLLRYYKDQKPEDLISSVACFEQALQDCPSTHPCRAVVLFNLATAQLISCKTGVTPPDFDVPISLYRDALDLRPVGHPDRPATLLHLARATMSHFLKWQDGSYAEEARMFIAQVQDICPVDSYVYHMANAILQERAPANTTNPPIAASLSTESPTSIPELQEVILRTPDCHPRKPAMLNALGFALLERCQKFGQPADMNGSILALEKAVELTADTHADWPRRVVSLGILLSNRFQMLRRMEDLERSISLSEKAVQCMLDGHPDRPMGIIHLGFIYSMRFDQLRQTVDIEKSISLQEKALGLLPNDHPEWSTFVSFLGAALLKRFQHLHDLAYLDRSISLLEEAERCPSRDQMSNSSPAYVLEQPDKGIDLCKAIFTRDKGVARRWRLKQLRLAFQLRFSYSGDSANLDKAISTIEDILKLAPQSHNDRPSDLADLGYTLLVRYHHHGNLQDLHNATSLLEESVQLTPHNHPGRPNILERFAKSLLSRFERLGKIVDIDRSISAVEEAVKLIPDRHANKPSLLYTLGVSLLKRFENIGNRADLEKSTSLMEEAVQLTPKDDPERSLRLTSLGVSSRLSFDRLGQSSTLDKSISALEEALQLASIDDDVKPVAMGGLAHGLMARSHRLGSKADLDRSISLRDEAVRLTENGDPTSLNTVSASLMTLHQGSVVDMDKMRVIMETALRHIPEGHPSTVTILFSIGNSLGHDFLTRGSLPSLRQAISYLSSAARSPASGQSSRQFQALKWWLTYAPLLQSESPTEGRQSLLEAYECAINLFPQLAWIGLPLKDRYTKLVEASDVVRSAASLAITLGHVTKAIEWLEQGRCVVWRQLFQLHTPLDELRRAYPDIADQIERISNALDHTTATYDEPSSYLGKEKDLGDSWEQGARHHRELVTQRESLIEQVQALPGFEEFLLPKSFSQLQASAHSGPIVVLTVNPGGGNALIIVADLDEPIHVPLPEINSFQVEHLRALLNKLLSNDGRVVSRDDSGRAARIATRNGRSTFSHILSELWKKVVLPVLHALAIQTPGDPTRIFWCPTGPLSFLPIHAAGYYDHPEPGNKASDFIISSYIPTLSVLEPSRERPVVSNSVRLLAVAQPSSDGQAHLSGARTEIALMRTTIERLSSTRVHLSESNGNVEDVLKGMECSDWVHFACHGVQDPESPTESGLCLADRRRLRLSDMIRLSRPRGGFAFLSACQTATGAADLSDEAVHLSAGMLYAGYSSVIGTMWSIMDSVAPQLAADVYEQLFRDENNVPDAREAARALHNAVERLRQSGEPFITWVPFIHMGI